MKTTIPVTFPDYSKLVGIPYSKADCFQFAKMFYAEILGKELHHYYETTPAELADRQDLIYTNMGQFSRVDNPQFGDIVLIKVLGFESHIAIYVGDGKIIHSLKTVGQSVVESSFRWRRVITGYFRPLENKS